MKKSVYTIIIILSLFALGIEAKESPNILLIIGDDMGVDAINGYDIGSNLPATPHLDELRASGVTFTNVWAAPVCAATRASIITGKYGVNNEVNTLPGHLKPRHKTIFTEIKELDSAYVTCLVGKWHLAKANNPNHPISHGVGEYMGVLGSGVKDYNQWLKVEDGVQDTCKEYVTSYFTDYAIHWINEQSQPWFMWLAHVAPHAPYHNVPAHMTSSESDGSIKSQYKSMIESLDYEIGRLLDSIPAEVLANTVIMFVGDNGTPGNVLQGFPNRRGKQTLYQGGINVPFVVSGLGVDRQGEHEDALINISDFYVTIAQIVDSTAFASGEVYDSKSFRSLLKNDEEGNRHFNYMELGSNNTIPNNIYTVRDERYKLIDLANGKIEMYNLVDDPLESEELIGKGLSAEQEVVKSTLMAQMDDIRGFSYVVEEPDTTTAPRGAATKYAIVHTGVRDFYDETSLINEPSISEDLYWQDAGRVMNKPSYTDNGDGTVSDNITGLMWQQNMGDKMNYSDAVSAASASRLGGYDDWRIPTIKELYSLILFSGRVFGESAETMFIDTDYFDQPLGNASIGEREIDAQTWSSTFYTSVTMNSDTTIFGVNFVDGRIKGYPKFKKRTGVDNTMYFRLVRGNEDYGKNVFVDNGDGTVTDSATMLMWQKADDGIARDWLSSISYCENLSLGGYDDWHLPNAKELQSLVDYSRSPDATNSAAIDPIFSTSTIDDAEGNSGHYPYFWSTSPHKDGPNPYSSAVYVAFGEAKGQMNGNLLDVHGAGSQRSDPKSGSESDYPKYHGPQGDVQRVYNHCRCVRTVGESTNLDDVEQEAMQVAIYPNPATDRVWVEVPLELSSVSLTVYDIRGVALLNQTIIEGVFVDISNLDSGMYLFGVRSQSMAFEFVRIVKK